MLGIKFYWLFYFFKDFILISILVGKFKMLKDFDDNMFLNELH